MKFRWLWCAAPTAAAVVVGCSAITSFSGLAAGEDAGTQGEDAGQVADGATAIDATTSASDTGADVGPNTCSSSTTIAATFAKDLGPFSPFSTIPSYPSVEPFFGDTALTLFPFRDISLVDAGPDADPVPKEAQFQDARSSVWLSAPLPLTSFDITFEAQIRCTSAASCADGLIFAWLDTKDPSVLTNKNYGNAAGLPDLIGGGGIDIDNYRNDPTETNDPYTPSLQIIQLDATQKAGVYAWQRAIEKLTFADAWHKYSIKQRGGAVTLSFDDVQQLTTTVSVVRTGLIGLTAGVGGQSDAVAVRNFTGTFYDCVAP